MEKEKCFQSQNEQGQTELEELPNSVPSFDEHMRNNIEKSHRKTFEEKAKEKAIIRTRMVSGCNVTTILVVLMKSQ